MDFRTHQTGSKRRDKDRKQKNPLKYTFDSHFLPRTPPDDDSLQSAGSNDSATSETEHSSESRDSGHTASLVAGFQLIANSVLRMEMAQLEMMKKREMARLEAQKRQVQLEDEMLQMMLQTQSQIASLVSQNQSSTKRKSSRVDDNASRKKEKLQS